MMNTRRVFVTFLTVAVAAMLFYYLTSSRHADEIFVDGSVYTVDPSFRVVEAMAIRDGRIVGTGTTAEIRRRFKTGKETSLGGKTVFPGLIDAHAHLTSLGIARLTVNLVGARSENEAAERIRERVSRAAPGQWIQGRGWDQNLWKARTFPHYSSLDRVAPAHPVILSRIDGHAVWVNGKAMELAGITAETPDPDGGRIVRDGADRPTGVFVDNAEVLITSHVPALTKAELQEAMAVAGKECLSVGLTGVHDMGTDMEGIEALKEMIERDEFHVRIYGVIGGDGETWRSFQRSGPIMGFGGDMLTVRALKLYADGALGSRGAALIEPYADEPNSRGLTVTSGAELSRLVGEALDAGFQVCTHAIGDRGNSLILDVYDKETAALRGEDVRLRVEHAQVLHPEDITRFRELGVLPSMQPTHCTSDMYWAEARLGPDRIRGAYAWRSLLETGVIIPGGSDFPVERPNPLEGLYAAVTRRDITGVPADADDVRNGFQVSSAGIADESVFDGGWYVNQRMTFEEALRSFTLWAATAAFEEEIKGSLEEGKLADFIVLDTLIDVSDPTSLLEANVSATYVGGRQVFTRLSQ